MTSATEAKLVPTALDAYLECLHILAELPGRERKRVIDALTHLSAFNPKLLTGVEMAP